MQHKFCYRFPSHSGANRAWKPNIYYIFILWLIITSASFLLSKWSHYNGKKSAQSYLKQVFICIRTQVLMFSAARCLTPKFLQICVQCFSAPEWQRSGNVSILVDVCASTGCGCVASLLRRSSVDPELFLLDDGAQRSNSAQSRSRQEIGRRYNIKTSSSFQNKTLRVDARLNFT